MEEYRANFLWPHSDGSVEEAGYEFANGATMGYQKQWWNILLERAALNSSRGRTSAVGSDEPSCIPTGSLKPAVLDNPLPAQALPASNTSQAEIAAAEKLCKLYFEIAAEVIGEEEVRKRVQRLLQP